MQETTQSILMTYLFDSFEVGNKQINVQLQNASRKKILATINQDLVDMEEAELDILSDYQSAYDDILHLTDEAFEQGKNEILSWEPTDASPF
ncbi:TPA: hypothetical protein U2C93_001441 [Streptococcus suis]|uniref:hypothetical protein n=1 Tax=Streptococcus suis TaxID=1307 RepID=UPI000CF3989F|nr:hypothetical protein [Streptococcus suis]MCB2922219.1 hypothetical protein [Streptococcus suis]MCB2932075.1 hypothetical protein [Streptococcus suis]MCB2941254.1 hypothetical protein [Streptococcus suis]MCB2941701.1 hypothetical protein [Streptococcus suis]MCB2945773.1 hypothetical protein [Streptococcus suis]